MFAVIVDSNDFTTFGGPKMIKRIAATAVIVLGASVGMASPATAELSGGTYAATMTAPNGATTPQTWVLTPCGPDCLNLQKIGGVTRDLYLRGTTWTGTDGDSKDPCTTTIDNNTLAGTDSCGLFAFRVQLAPGG